MKTFVFLLITITCGAMAMSTAEKHQLECLGCNDGVQMLNYWLTAPLTKSGLGMALEDLCNLFGPGTNEAKYCLTTVQTALGMILRDVVGFTVEICPMTLQCKPAPPTLAATEARAPKLANFNAGLCTVFDKLIADMPTIAPKFVTICANLTGEAQTVCYKSFKEQPKIIVEMADKFAQHLFNMIPFVNCALPAKNIQLAATATAPPPDLKCQACWDGIDLLNYFIGSPFVVKSLADVMSKACDGLGEPLSSACATSLNGTFVMVVEDIQGFINLTCPTSALHCKPPTPSSFKFKAIQLGTKGFHEICTIMQPLYDQIPTNYMYWEKVCTQQKSTITQTACKAFFEQHPDQVIGMLQYFLPALIEKMTFEKCDFGQTVAQPKLEVAHTKLNFFNCEACLGASKLLGDLLNSPLSVKGFEYILQRSICNKLYNIDPSAGDTKPLMNSECKASINTLTTHIIQYVDTYALSFVCEKDCTRKMVASKEGSTVEKEGTDLTEWCMMGHALQRHMPAVVDNAIVLCDKLATEKAKTDCRTMLQDATQTGEIVDGMNQLISTILSANPFGDCPTFKVGAKSYPKGLPKLPFGTKCLLCRTGIMVVQDFVDNPLVVQGLKYVIHKGCKMTPMENYCKSTVDIFVGDMLNFVNDQILDPICGATWGGKPQANGETCPTDGHPTIHGEILKDQLRSPGHASIDISKVCKFLNYLVIHIPDYINDVRKLCSLLPSKDAVKCRSFIDEYKMGVQSYMTAGIHEIEKSAGCDG